MGKIVAIGGGHIGETIGEKTYSQDILSIDKEIINLTKKKNPKLLFIPTASSDSESYSKIIKKYFGKLGCKIDVLYLIKNKYSKKELRKKILSTDIIYVGGGNTLKMMNVWKRLGVDKLLLEAYKSNIILSGISAGAICWNKYGNSDSRKFKNPKAKLIRVSGLNIFNLLLCPHYNKEKFRKPELKTMMKKNSCLAIALDNCTALEIIDDNYRIISSKKIAYAYKVYWKNKKYYQIKILKDKKFKPLNELLTK